MAIAQVQATGAAPAAGTSIVKAFTSNVTAGSLLVCAVTVYNSAKTPTVSDNLNGSWSQAVSYSNTAVLNHITRIFYRANSAGGVCTVTASWSGSASGEIHMGEYSGADTSAPLDQTGTGGSTSSGTASTSTMTPSVDGELIWGWCGFLSSGSPGSGFTLVNNTNGNDSEYRVQATAASAAATWSSTGGWVAVAATFKPAVTATTLTAVPIGSAEAFGTPALATNVSVPSTGIASTETLGIPTVSSGNANVAATAVASAEAPGSPILAPGNSALSLSGIATAEAFGLPSFSTAINLAQSGIASAEAFGSPSLAAGNTSLSLSGIPSSEAFGSPSVSSSGSVLTPTGTASAESFGSPAIAPGNTALTLAGIASGEAFGLPTLAPVVTLSSTGVASGESFGAPSLTATRAFALTGIPSGEALGSVAFTADRAFALSGIGSAEIFGGPGIATATTVSTASIASAEAFGTLGFLPAITRSVLGIPSAEAFGAVATEQGFILAVPSIASAERVSTPRFKLIVCQRVTTYPNGQVLTSMALTPLALSTLLQTLTCQMLGIDPATDTAAYSKVRLDWQTLGQPGPRINEDVVYLKVTEEDDAYNRIRDRRILPNNGASVQSVDTFTRVWRVTWSCYGPNSFDNARLVKSTLLTLDFPSDTLNQVNLYIVSDIAATTRNPELFQGQWWERTDLSVCLNELVEETLTVPTIASAEIVLIGENGQLADLTF